MARLPQPGSDADQWGVILNEFLQVAHNDNGTLRDCCPVVNVRDYGALGNGGPKDAEAIQCAIHAAEKLRRDVPDKGPGAASVPTVCFPAGIYCITHTIYVSHYITLQGDSAILFAEPGANFPLLEINGYKNRIEGFIFSNGRNHIRIVGPNNDTMTTFITNCEFRDCTEVCIKLDPIHDPDRPGFSMHLLVERFKSYNAPLFAGGCDWACFRDGWISFDSYDPVRQAGRVCFDTVGTLFLEDILGVGQWNAAGLSELVQTSDNTGYWVRLDGGALTAIRVRWGENGVHGVKVDPSNPDGPNGRVQGVSFVDCMMTAVGQTSSGGEYWMHIYRDFPASIVVKNTTGFAEGKGVFVDQKSFDLDRLYRYNTEDLVIDVDENPMAGVNGIATFTYHDQPDPLAPNRKGGMIINDCLATFFRRTGNIINDLPDANLFVPGVVSSLQGPWNRGAAVNIVALSNPDETTGYPLQVLQCQFSDERPSNYAIGLDWGSGTPAGVYCFSCYVKSSAAAILDLIYRDRRIGEPPIGDTAGQWQRVYGVFYHDGAASFLQINLYRLPAGATFSFGLFAVHRGYRPAPYTVPGNPITDTSIRETYYNSTWPASGAYKRGDIVWNTAPVPGDRVGWICVSAGSPGAWKGFGAIDQ